MAGLKVLILVFLLLGVVQVRGKCVTLPHCTCQEGANGEREFQCGANPETDDPGIISQIKSEVALIVQCNFNTTSSDLDMLRGMKVGPVQTIQFRYCPLPLIPLGELIEHITGNTLNSTKAFIFQSHRTIGNGLNKKHFEKLFNVVKLELSSNELTEIPEDLLEFMPGLTRLDMRENSLQYLPPGLLWSTPKLQELELGKNLLTQIPEDFFIQLTSLRLLNLWRNNLLSLNSTTFASLPSLETLDLHLNGLKTLPHDIFYNLTKLSDLNLSSNNFTSLPEGLFKESKNLFRLRLLDNQVSSNIELPNGILSDLPKLKEISISRSGISKLPSNFIRGSIGLTSLTIIDNNIATIPGGLFQDAANLTMLDLSNNRLQTLPKDAFVGLKKLKTLRLGRNKLEILSNDLFSSLEKLEELDLSKNEIAMVESGAFQGVPKLRVLRLDNNKLKFVGGPNDFFGSYSPLHLCIQLEELLLANNSINDVFADWRISMLKLRKLDLTYNNFTQLSMEDLHFLSEHLTIDLRHNHIRVLNVQNAERLALQQEMQAPSVGQPHHARSVEVLLANNPIDCDSCYTFDLLRYQENRMNPAVRRLLNISTAGVHCDSKSSLSGMLLSQISSVNFTCEIEEKNCPMGCECNMRLYDKAINLKCCRQLESLPELSNFLNRTEYSLKNCGIEAAPNIFQIKNHEKISAFYLSNNNISMFRVKNLPDKVDILELHNNNISILSEAVVRHLRENATFLRRLTLSGNPWQCDCEAKDLLGYVQENFKLVPDLVNVTCVDGRQFSQLTTSDLCDVNAKIAVAASMAIAVAGILLGAAAALYYRYQQEIKVWLYARNLCLWFVTEDELDKDKRYDAFISYSHKDEEFVAQHLVPGLEPPFKLCIHVRDWVAGDWIPEQIARSVANSRRTLVILSPSFIDSIWGRMEFRAAHQQALSEGRVRVIVILLDDVGPIDNLDPELRAYLTMNTYLKWGDPLFWDKLRYALPHRQEIAPNNHGGWGWGKRRVRDISAVMTSRMDDKLEMTRTGVDFTAARNVITTPPSPDSHTPPAAIADQNGICRSNGNTRVV